MLKTPAEWKDIVRHLNSDYSPFTRWHVIYIGLFLSSPTKPPMYVNIVLTSYYILFGISNIVCLVAAVRALALTVAGALALRVTALEVTVAAAAAAVTVAAAGALALTVATVEALAVTLLAGAGAFTVAAAAALAFTVSAGAIPLTCLLYTSDAADES